MLTFNKASSMMMILVKSSAIDCDSTKLIIFYGLDLRTNSKILEGLAGNKFKIILATYPEIT